MRFDAALNLYGLVFNRPIRNNCELQINPIDDGIYLKLIYMWNDSKKQKPQMLSIIIVQNELAFFIATFNWKFDSIATFNLSSSCGRKMGLLHNFGCYLIQIKQYVSKL